jgi:hypothetical protein
MATTTDNGDAPKQWVPPKEDQEFVFEGLDKAPSWIDKGWASYNMGPALALPAGDLFGEGPYHTKTARVGDTVIFKAASPSKTAHFEVVVGEPTEDMQVRIPQVSAASLEDMLKTGWLSKDDLSEDAKAQVLNRSPRLRALIEEDAGKPDEVKISEVVKTG